MVAAGEDAGHRPRGIAAQAVGDQPFARQQRIGRRAIGLDHVIRRTSWDNSGRHHGLLLGKRHAVRPCAPQIFAGTPLDAPYPHHEHGQGGELPVGRGSDVRRRRAVSRVGAAPTSRRSRARGRPGRRNHGQADGGRAQVLRRRSCARPGRARGIAFDWTAARRSIPIRRRDISPRARTALPRSSDPHAVRLDRRGLVRGVPPGSGHLRDAHRHLHAGRNLGGGGRATARAGRAWGSRCWRSCRSPISRAVRVGIRRRLPLRAHAPLWHAGRLPALRRSGPRAAGSA